MGPSVVDTDSESPTLPLKERTVAGVAKMLMRSQNKHHSELKQTYPVPIILLKMMKTTEKKPMPVLRLTGGLHGELPYCRTSVLTSRASDGFFDIGWIRGGEVGRG
jgi:hypothetical protein